MSVVLAGLASWDVLCQFYNRYDIPSGLLSRIMTPVRDATKFRHHALGLFDEWAGSSRFLPDFLTPSHTSLSEYERLEAFNGMIFVVEMMFLSYFVYKRTLKGIPSVSIFTLSDYALVTGEFVILIT